LVLVELVASGQDLQRPSKQRIGIGWAMVSLKARMAASIGNHIEADRARLGAPRSNAVAEGLPRIFRQ
jgi:hypothetical protein